MRYGETVTAFTWSQLKKVSIKETEPTTAVEEVSVKPAFQVTPGEVAIQGAEPGSVAQVFSVSGDKITGLKVYTEYENEAAAKEADARPEVEEAVKNGQALDHKVNGKYLATFFSKMTKKKVVIIYDFYYLEIGLSY